MLPPRSCLSATSRTTAFVVASSDSRTISLDDRASTASASAPLREPDLLRATDPRLSGKPTAGQSCVPAAELFAVQDTGELRELPPRAKRDSRRALPAARGSWASSRFEEPMSTRSDPGSSGMWWCDFKQAQLRLTLTSELA